MLVAICLISLLISIPGFIKKAGYSFFKGLIPFYNIYLFFSIIEFPPVLLMLLALGLIFLPDRMFIATLLCVLLPFLVNDAFGKGKISSLFTLVLPFVMYPYLGYLSGVYCYDVSEGKHMFFKKNKFWLVLIVVFSLYMYTNFTVLVDGNSLINRDDMHYVNMTDGGAMWTKITLENDNVEGARRTLALRDAIDFFMLDKSKYLHGNVIKIQ